MIHNIKLIIAVCCTTFVAGSSMAQNQPNWQMKAITIQTRWAKQVNPQNVLPEYPRPQMVRKNWHNLNGLWQYAITKKDGETPNGFDGQILVPFSIESALSGVQKPLKPEQLLWYKRSFADPRSRSRSGISDLARMTGEERILLHFGAVDFEAFVYLNGKEIGRHSGGYQAFSFDITDELKSGDNELVVKVWDPTDKGPNPHGKQVLNPQGIMYTASSGIWQTVWMETVPVDYIKGLKITPNVDGGEVVVLVKHDGSAKATIKVPGCNNCGILKQVQDKGGTRFTVRVPNAKLWSPDSPFLYDLEVTLGNDKVESYFGMRKIEVKKDDKGIDRIFLNGKYTYNLGTLDQGFWPDGLYTAPTDEALAYDVIAAKAMGFNTIRKHIKLEPARWYYHADKLGMLVWQDLVNPGNLTPEGKAQFEKESKQNIEQLYNYPSITTWVLFNEKWGQYDQERLTKWIKSADPTRLVNGHSGEMLYVNNVLRSPSPDAWIGADMTDVHAYPNPGHIKFEKGKVAVLGEFGGIGVPVEGHFWDDLKAGWGYDGMVSPMVLKKQYTDMVDSLKRLEAQGLSASIYTQPFDVESEQNGMMTYDRRIIKLPVEVIRNIHSKLWPTTRNYATAAKGFITKVADTMAATYAVRLTEYRKGKREADFIRALAIMASNLKDEKIAEEVSTEYIKIMKEPMILSNLKFINQFTKTSKDLGFGILFNNVEEADRILDFNRATGKIQGIIYDEEIKPYEQLPMDRIDWASIEKSIKSKYSGPLSDELYLRTKLVYYANNKGWDNLVATTKEWMQKYDAIVSNYILNDIAWVVFENVTNKAILKEALLWSERAIRDSSKAEYIDTYANLLYKLGQNEEAIKWQTKAVQLNPKDEGMTFTLAKMQKGERTW